MEQTTKPEETAVRCTSVVGDESNLRACPCCGGRAVMTTKGNDHTPKRSVTIKCRECHLQRTDAAIRNSVAWLEVVAAEQWNRRTDERSSPTAGAEQPGVKQPKP